MALKAVAIDERNENNFIGAQGSNVGASTDDGDTDYLYINDQVKSEFLKEYRNSCNLSSHANILTAYDILFQVKSVKIVDIIVVKLDNRIFIKHNDFFPI